MKPEEKESASKEAVPTGETASSLSAMYVLAVLLLFVGSIVIILMMFVPSDWRNLFGGGEQEAVYIPGSQPGFSPISRDAALSEPPGVYPLERGHYRVVIDSYNWEFYPREIRLPVGAQVEIVARSSQDYHGFAIANTNISMQLFHNRVAQASYTFDQPGEYLFVCSEYCGTGHVTMTGKIIVE